MLSLLFLFCFLFHSYDFSQLFVVYSSFHLFSLSTRLRPYYCFILSFFLSLLSFSFVFFFVTCKSFPCYPLSPPRFACFSFSTSLSSHFCFLWSFSLSLLSSFDVSSPSHSPSLSPCYVSFSQFAFPAPHYTSLPPLHISILRHLFSPLSLLFIMIFLLILYSFFLLSVLSRYFVYFPSLSFLHLLTFSFPITSPFSICYCHFFFFPIHLSFLYTILLFLLRHISSL